MCATLVELLLHQFEASLCTLHLAIARCPEANWEKAVGTLRFCQVGFHAVFFADLYLQAGEGLEGLRGQGFHVEHAGEFGDYEELEDREPVRVYGKPFVMEYLKFVRSKARETVSRESEEVLAGPSGFSWRKCSRAELHVYNIRHIQHHAAQLSLRLRVDAGVEIPWVGHGWRDE